MSRRVSSHSSSSSTWHNLFIFSSLRILNLSTSLTILRNFLITIASCHNHNCKAWYRALQQHSRRKIESLKLSVRTNNARKKLLFETPCVPAVSTCARIWVVIRAAKQFRRREKQFSFTIPADKRKVNRKSAGRTPRRSNGNFPFHFSCFDLSEF